MKTSMLRGISTVNIFADDHKAAVNWYTDILGVEPYYNKPGYAEFRIGDDELELGIVAAQYAPGTQSQNGARAGIVAYWCVDSLDAAIEEWTSKGATPLEPKTDRGNGFVTASFVDPFGNLIGLMENPHYNTVRK